jgi:hypothetical protein
MSGSVVRPLPARPDLESERKRAKQLLRDVHRGEAEALARVAAQNHSLAGAAADSVRLADAQLTIAREYGFRSWPLLVRYYETFDRHLRSDVRRLQYRSDFYKGWPETLLHEHQQRRYWTALTLGAFVPRFYGLTVDEIFSSEVTVDDAQLATARGSGYTSWDELLRDADRLVPPPGTDADKSRRELSRAMRDGNLGQLRSLVDQHPELLGYDRAGDNILGAATLYHHFGKDSSASREIVNWVASLGVDLQLELNRKLLGGMRMSVEAVDRLIAMGADPAWIAPNGYSVLEHAIHRYWNGAAVDRIAARVKAPESFWVASGLGDVTQMRRYFNRSGKLTQTARDTWPDVGALGRGGGPSLPQPDEVTLLFEAAIVATTNARPAALDVLIDRGLPIDYSPGMNLLSFATTNGMRDMVEMLIARGASPHVRGWRPNATALELAIDRYAANPDDGDSRRILELCGGDPDRVRAEAEATRVPPSATEHVQRACVVASADAVAQGRTTVGVENMAVALLRQPTEIDFGNFESGGVTVAQMQSMLGERFSGPLAHTASLLADDELKIAIDAAVAAAAARRENHVLAWDIWPQLLVSGTSAAAHLIRQAGGDPAKVRDQYLAMYTRRPQHPFR